MDRKIGLLGYLSQVFTIYGITTLLLNCFCLLFGDEEKNVSSIFSLGDQGVAIATSFQFFLAIALIIVLRFVFMTDIIIKKMPLALRIIALFSGVLAVMVGFIFAFDWFPVTELLAWILFSVCFVLSCLISTLVSILYEKQENKKLEEALKRFKAAQ